MEFLNQFFSLIIFSNHDFQLNKFFKSKYLSIFNHYFQITFDTINHSISSIFSILSPLILLPLLFYLTFTVYHFYSRKQPLLTTLHSLLHTSSPTSLPSALWTLLLLYRWLFTLTVLIFLRHSPLFQILLLLIASLLFQILSLQGNKSNIFNEVMISVFLYLMLATVEINGENRVREEIGWGLLGVVVFTVGVNVVKAMIRDI